MGEVRPGTRVPNISNYQNVFSKPVDDVYTHVFSLLHPTVLIYHARLSDYMIMKTGKIMMVKEK